MPEYTIQTEKLNEIMELLFHVLNIRITFFDRDGNKLSAIREEICPFCRSHRKDPFFDALCVQSDLTHVEEAKKKHDMVIYHCHAGLLDGVVPFYNRNGNYLGSIVFGQVADRQNPIKGVRLSDETELKNVARLLKCLSEYICENELIRKTSAPWTLRFEEYIRTHISENITLAAAARHIGCSISFLSHNIPLEYGKTFKAYIREKKMTEAKKLLSNGFRVSECAARLGFYDAFYFSKEFKKYNGISPAVWLRRQNFQHTKSHKHLLDNLFVNSPE